MCLLYTFPIPFYGAHQSVDHPSHIQLQGDGASQYGSHSVKNTLSPSEIYPSFFLTVLYLHSWNMRRHWFCPLAYFTCQTLSLCVQYGGSQLSEISEAASGAAGGSFNFLSLGCPGWMVKLGKKGSKWDQRPPGNITTVLFWCRSQRALEL